MRRPRNVAEWLHWQELLHPAEIELGLDRLRQVAGRMGWPSAAFFLISVGGTNGKGSAVATTEAILRASGYRTGAYTSPHLLRYSERIRVHGKEVTDETLCHAFERVERARGDVPLTYFEFGTLAAVDIFHGANCEVVVLEVGLGGRLDAVNLFDADLTMVMSIAVDHTDWLGPDRETIAREKAGIFRSGCPAVCGDPSPPATLREAAHDRGASLYILGRDFHYAAGPAHWSYGGPALSLEHLPYPRIPGDGQLRNAATVLMALETVRDTLPTNPEAIRSGLRSTHIPGRLQVLTGVVERILDVAHNPDAAAELARFLRHRPCRGQTHAVVAMLGDKDMVGVASELAGEVDRWYVAGLEAARGARPETMAVAVRKADPAAQLRSHGDVVAAYRDALSNADAVDRVVVFGSFLTVAAVLRLELG